MKGFKEIVPLPINNVLKRALCCWQWDPWRQISWSQEGEDQILRRIFERQSYGFYVDIGAHHPKRFSNTYLFYRKGWTGINVDAMPGSMQAFKKVRPRDINLEFGVGTKEGELDYYLFNEPALNGFSKELSERRHVAETPYKILEVVKVNVKPLSKILEEYKPHGQVIDFLNIDVEGLDLDVLRSNDWQRYRPKLVLIEVLGNSLRELGGSEIGKFMEGINYSVYAKCMNTVFFKDNSRGFQS
jgi:FkbM family methyltransferase